MNSVDTKNIKPKPMDFDKDGNGLGLVRLTLQVRMRIAATENALGLESNEWSAGLDFHV